MKSESTTPANLTMAEIMEHFATDEQAREYLELIRWPNGKVCPHCGNTKQERIWKIKPKGKLIRKGLYHCGECDKQFTVTVGTIFESTHIPLRKWLIAWYLLCSSKKGMSSLQFQRILKLGSYRTALFMTHRIRHALRDPVFAKKLAGTVEADETYVGGKVHGKGMKAAMEAKTPVFSLVERGGDKRSFVMQQVTGANLKSAICEHVAKGSIVYTDEHQGYKGMKDYMHASVCHGAGEYARGDVSTNGVESSFALLKRGIVGTFHQISKHHLPLYLAEFDFRWNKRKVNDGERTIAALKKMEGKRLMYKTR